MNREWHGSVISRWFPCIPLSRDGSILCPSNGIIGIAITHTNVPPQREIPIDLPIKWNGNAVVKE